MTRTLLDLTYTRPADGRRLAALICRSCTEGLDVDGAALSIMTASTARRTLWATDPVAQTVEDLQFTMNEGPCMEAATTGHAVLMPAFGDGDAESRWPAFSAAVLEQSPVAALFALPLRWGSANLGVLDLYRLRPGELDDAQLNDALGAADVAALLLIDEHTSPESRDGVIEESSASHLEIHQATGMVIAQLGLGAADALARLRAHAFAHHSRLDDVARDVVEHRLVFSHDMA